MPATSRYATIVFSVVLLHAGLIYTVYNGQQMQQPRVIPVVMLSQFIEPPKPKEVLPPPVPAQLSPASPVAANAKQPVAQAFNPAPTRAPVPASPAPAAIVDQIPAPNAPGGTSTPQAAPAKVVEAAGGPAVSAQAGAAPVTAVVQLPASDADYLQNPRPAYPSISRRLNEQGKTMVRVLIGADGQPQRAEIAKSSGFNRLDDAALNTVMRWRYVPGKRGGIAEAMWFNVPIHWVLE